MAGCFRVVVISSLVSCLLLTLLEGSNCAPYSSLDRLPAHVPYYYRYFPLAEGTMLSKVFTVYLFVVVLIDGDSLQQRQSFLNNLGAAFFSNLISSPVVTNIINNAINSTISTVVPLFVNNLISATLNATSPNRNRTNSTASPRSDFPFVLNYQQPIQLDSQLPNDYFLPYHNVQYVPFYYYAVNHPVSPKIE